MQEKWRGGLVGAQRPLQKPDPALFNPVTGWDARATVAGWSTAQRALSPRPAAPSFAPPPSLYPFWDVSSEGSRAPGGQAQRQA